MPRYDYKCEEHGYFEQWKPMSEHSTGQCPECDKETNQVLRSAPGLDIEGMADAGLPGAFSLSGDRMTKRHTRAGQEHHKDYWRNQ